MGAELCYYDDYEESHLEIRSDVNETFNTFTKRGDKGFKKWLRELKYKEEDEYILDASSTNENNNEIQKS